MIVACELAADGCRHTPAVAPIKIAGLAAWLRISGRNSRCAQEFFRHRAIRRANNARWLQPLARLNPTRVGMLMSSTPALGGLTWSTASCVN